MDSSSNNTKSIKKKLVDELLQGYKFTTQLQLLLDQTSSVSNSDSVSYDPDLVHDLLTKILGSFNTTISVLDSFDPIAVEGSRNASCGDDSTAPVSCNGGDSGDSKKRLGVVKGKRGCYTRKKRSHTRIVEARTIEDNFAWRKYGQKEILNTKFPRSYFRCTHKPTQGCEAIKQVQKLKHNPEMFQITYIGYHTCTSNDQTHAKTEPITHEIIMDSDNTLTVTTAPIHVQEQENNNISSVTTLVTDMVKGEVNNNGENKEYCEASSTGEEDLSLVWQEDMMMFEDHHHHHQNQYYYGETTSQHFAFIDNDDQFSPFYNSFCV